MKLPWNRGGLRTYLLVLALAFARPGSGALWYGSALLLLGVALQVYSKGCLRQNRVVAMGGPYRFVRHPFYTANLMIDEGIALISGCLPLAMLLPVWWLLVYLPVMRQEEAHLSALFPDIYPPYQRRLPRLFPFRRPLPSEGDGFSWANANIASDTVIPRALRLSSYPLLFLVWGGLRTHGVSSVLEGDALMLGAIALLLSLHSLSRMLERHLKDRRRIFPACLPVAAVRAGTALLVLTAAMTIHWGEVESRLLLALGVLTLAASVVLQLRNGPLALAAEGAALLSVPALCELPWLCALPVLVYLGLALDMRLERGQSLAGGKSLPKSGHAAASLAYSLLVLAGVALAVAKEVL
jgi:hypothetical protein